MRSFDNGTVLLIDLLRHHSLGVIFDWRRPARV
jgi:hypothetical protein